MTGCGRRLECTRSHRSSVTIVIIGDARGRCRKACRKPRAGCADRVARGDFPVGDAAREGLDFSGHVVAELWVGEGVSDRVGRPSP